MKICKKCESVNIKHEERQSRGFPPKNWVRKRGDSRRISWKVTRDIYICEDCGNIVKKLRK